MPGIQLTIQMMMSLFHLMYASTVWPFEGDADNYIEIFNEGCILVSITFLMTYALGEDVSPENGSFIGWILIVLILVNITGNVLIFLRATLRTFYWKVYIPLKRKLTNWNWESSSKVYKLHPM